MDSESLEILKLGSVCQRALSVHLCSFLFPILQLFPPYLFQPLWLTWSRSSRYNADGCQLGRLWRHRDRYWVLACLCVSTVVQLRPLLCKVALGVGGGWKNQCDVKGGGEHHHQCPSLYWAWAIDQRLWESCVSVPHHSYTAPVHARSGQTGGLALIKGERDG